MKKIIISLILVCALFCGNLFNLNAHQNILSGLDSNLQGVNHTYSDEVSISTVYYNATDFKLLGKLPQTQGYSRLPNEAMANVRKEVWNLSKQTAGISIRFTSNTTSIKIKWTSTGHSEYTNMTPIASKGFDLYAYVNDRWQFVGEARPQNSIENEATIIEGMAKIGREYLLHLPLYDSVSAVEIGVDENAYIGKPRSNLIDTSNPIVFYGTSITQGASASRPGLTYPARIQRSFNKEVINLGFSGNGRFEKAVGKYFMVADPSIIILDCTPNSSATTIKENLPDLIEFIRIKDASVPIILVESIMRDGAYFKKNPPTDRGTMSYIDQQNQALNDIFIKYSEKYGQLHYISGENLIGNDNEATVDGTHFNDVGHNRAYQHFKSIIKTLNIQ